MKNQNESSKKTNYVSKVEVYGAREHNLKNIDVSFPRDKLVVITGISGSGKSSLAFDTIYAEGQRRYIECFALYARTFLGNLSRPKVDKIEGLSPVIAIEQKTTSNSIRSTVGTITEIYDFLRLLYAKIGVPYSYKSGNKMIKQNDSQVYQHISTRFKNQIITILSPLVKSRKGNYKDLLNKVHAQGYLKVRIDGNFINLTKNMSLDRYTKHDIELIIDRIDTGDLDTERLSSSLVTAFKNGNGEIIVLDNQNNKYYYSKNLMDPETGLSYEEPSPSSFSFNSPIGACKHCGGIGEEILVNEDNILGNQDKSIKDGGILPIGSHKNNWTFAIINCILKNSNLTLDTPIKDIPQDILQKILEGSNEELEVDYRDEIWSVKFTGVIARLKKKILNKDEQSDLSQFIKRKICDVCKGNRLKIESLHYKIHDKSIADLSNMDLKNLYEWLSSIGNKLNEKHSIIAKEPIKEIKGRLKSIIKIGLEYLCLNRPVRTLSGGETQRIRLATQIGTQLIGVLYILDEPSIGLHPRDNQKLIVALKTLRDQGNSLLIVEHDKDLMLQSDYIIDIGPGAGKHGGTVVSAGDPEVFLKQNSVTALFLKGEENIQVPSVRREGNGKYFKIKGCKGNNLKNINLNIPLGKLICVTGVSGSGKSSLIHDTLYKILSKKLNKNSKEPLSFDSFEGIENIDKVVEVDQTPLGKSPRSNTITYTGVFTHIRSLFSVLPEAKIRGYRPGRFSFNVRGGRCENCEGGGIKLLEMDFLPSVRIPCEMCRGKRYSRETLEVTYKGKSIADVLDMTVDKAAIFFEKYPKIFNVLNTLKNVGLGYISLGQHANTLSGGEAQRIKLATELSKKDTRKTIYILDEPTTGLHFQDIKLLITILNRLVDKGNTVLVIEHNLDIIKIADYIIDIGPEGGELGGKIVAEGTPEEIIAIRKGYTGKFLKKELKVM